MLTIAATDNSGDPAMMKTNPHAPATAFCVVHVCHDYSGGRTIENLGASIAFLYSSERKWHHRISKAG
jgi:hypothetical protein